MSSVVLSGYKTQAYISGFTVHPATDGSIGAFAFQFDSSGRLYVANNADGFVYRFPSGGATANSSYRLDQAPVPTPITGLSGLVVATHTDHTQHLYVTSLDNQSLQELGIDSGAVLRTLSTSIPCAGPIVQDPLSGDLMVASLCSNTINRVSNIETTATIGVFASGAVLAGPDGLAFDQAGDLYVATTQGVVLIPRTVSGTAGVATLLYSGGQFNGLAWQAGSGGAQGFLYGSRSDGELVQLDLNASGLNPQIILEGNSRGEGVALDAGGCVYAALGDQIAKVSHADGTCLSGPVATATPMAAPSASATPTATVTATALPQGAQFAAPATLASDPSLSKVYGSFAGDDRAIYFTRACDMPQKVYALDQNGTQTVLTTLPVDLTQCRDVHLAYSPGQHGFPDHFIYAALGNQIYAINRNGAASLLTTMPGPFTDDYTLAFDLQGGFGFDMIAADTSGHVWSVAANGDITDVGDLGTRLGEGDVASASFGPFGGMFFVPEPDMGRVVAVEPDGTVYQVANWPSGNSLRFLPPSLCGLGATSYTYLTSELGSSGNLLRAWKTADLENLQTPPAALLTSGSAGLASLRFDGSNYVMGQLGGSANLGNSAFVSCEAAFVNGSLSLEGYALVNVPRDLSGLVNVPFLDTWTLSMKGTSQSAFTQVASGSSDVSGALYHLDWSSLPSAILQTDTTYKLHLESTDLYGQVQAYETFVSRGNLRFAGQMAPSVEAVQFGHIANDTVTGHVYVGAGSNVFEYDQTRQLVATHALPGQTIRAVLIYNGKIYVSDYLGSKLRSYSLPASSGADLGPEQAEYAGVAGNPEGLALFEGKLYVVIYNGDVKVLDPITLSPVSGQNELGASVLGGEQRGIAVSTLRREIYVSHFDKIEVFAADGYAYLRSIPVGGQYVLDLSMDDARGLLYGAVQSINSVVAYDPVRGVPVLQTQTGTGEGQTTSPWGVALEPNGQIVVTETGINRLQWFEAAIQAPLLKLTVPCYALTTAASQPIQGQITAPGLGYNWVLSLIQGTTVLNANVASGSSDMPANSLLSNLNVSGLATGTYKLQLQLNKPGQQPLTTQAFFSIGNIRFAGQLLPSPENVEFGHVTHDPATGHIYVGAGSNVAEYDQAKRLVMVHALPGQTIREVLIYGGKLYVSDYNSSKLRSYLLPVSSGADLGAELAEYAGVAGNPEGLAVFEGKLYVVIYNGDVKVLDPATLSPVAGLNEVGAGVLGGEQRGMAISAVRREIYVSHFDKIEVFAVDGYAYLRSIPVGGQYVLDVSMDDARGLLYGAVQSLNSVLAYNPASSAVVAQTQVGTAEGQTTSPWGVELEPSGQIVVTETGINRLQWLEVSSALSVFPTRTMTLSPTLSPSGTATPTTTATPSSSATVTLSSSATDTSTPTSTITATATDADTATCTATVSSTGTPTSSPSSTSTSTNTPNDTATPSLTVTTMSSVTLTYTETPSVTGTSSVTNSITPTNTVTPSVTDTVTTTSTATPSCTETPSATGTSTVTDSVTPTNTITLGVTGTSTITSTGTSTFSPTHTSTLTESVTPTNTVTPSVTGTVTATSTATPSCTETPSATGTSTETVSVTPTNTVTPSVTDTMTATSTATPSYTETLSATGTCTVTDSVTPTDTVTPSVTGTSTVTLTSTASFSATSTATITSSVTPSYTETPSATGTPAATDSITPTGTDTPSVTSTSTITPTATASFSASPTVTGTSSVSFTPTDTPSLSATPTRTATSTPSPVNTLTLTATLSVTASPSRTPSRTPTVTFTRTASGTATKTATRTASPSPTRTGTPTVTRTRTASPSPTPSPTRTPSGAPCLSYAVLANSSDGIFSGFVTTDSYRSSLGAYGGSNRFSNGNVRAAGSITVAGTATINGSRTASSPSNLTPLPTPVTYTYLGDLDVAASQTYTFSAGDYVVDNMTVDGSATIHANGQVRVWFNSLVLAGAAGTGGSTPAQLAFFSRSSATQVNINNITTLVGVIYAPNLPINAAGTGSIYGALVGSTCNLNGSIAVHYDEDLSCGSGPFGISSLSASAALKDQAPASLLPAGKSLIVVPNPSRGKTVALFHLPKEGSARLTIFDLAGEAVSRVSLPGLKAGDNSVELNTSHLASGVYILVLEGDTDFGMNVLAQFKMAIIH